MTQRLWTLTIGIAMWAPVQPMPAPNADYHQHLFSPAAVARSPTVQPIDATALVRLLDEAGIRRAVVLSLAYQFGNPNRPPLEDEYDRVKAENDWTSEQVAAFPDRLRAFCSVNPLKDYALTEIDRCAKDARLRLGLKLHFGNSDVDLATAAHLARLRAIFAAANGHGMAIIVHARSTISMKRPYGSAYARAFLEHLLPVAPDVPVQIAHLAGAGGYGDPMVDEALDVFADAVARSDARMNRVLFDVSGVCHSGCKAQATRIAARIRQLGVARILYGSDGAGGANPTPREAWASFKELPLSDAELRTIATNVAPYMR